jgi:hypothetical protein
MAKNTNIIDFLKANRRIVDISNHEELLYRIRAKTGLEIESITEIVNLLFEEIINLLIDTKTIKLPFAKLAITAKNLKITFKALKELRDARIG